MKVFSIDSKGVSYPVLLDDEDFDYICSTGWWFIVHSKTPGLFYARGEIDGKKRQMHRVIYQRHKPLLDTEDIDHIDGNGLNNQMSNLRAVNTRQNGQNRRKRVVKGSRYKGVCKGYKGSWRAAVKSDKCQQVIKSSFPTERMAAIAYDNYAREHFGEYACLNIPDAPAEEIAEVAAFTKAWTYRNKTSKYRGVCYASNAGKWQVSFWVNGKANYFGQFETELEAAQVYNQKATELLGDKAKLNIIP